MKVYVVKGSSGEWDSIEWSVRAFLSAEKAQAFADLAQVEAERIQKEREGLMEKMNKELAKMNLPERRKRESKLAFEVRWNKWLEDRAQVCDKYDFSQDAFDNPYDPHCQYDRSISYDVEELEVTEE